MFSIVIIVAVIALLVEINQDIEVLELTEGTNIQAYSLSDFVAEKYRALIQQKTRNRLRRQDAFDIYWLIKNDYLQGPDIKTKYYDPLRSNPILRECS